MTVSIFVSPRLHQPDILASGHSLIELLPGLLFVLSHSIERSLVDQPALISSRGWVLVLKLVVYTAC